MTKGQLITALEEKTITTADGEKHVVKDGKFVSKSGATVKLESLNKFHLEIFLRRSKL